MELKYYDSEDAKGNEEVLIVPLWNWNSKELSVESEEIGF